jgi:antitoxin (DNA-binding transcriptional repressor) of toxin-antitoxin stability system
MNTITTKHLRENMAQVVRDLKSGSSLELSYRHKVIAVVKPVKPSAAPLRRGSAHAIQDFLAHADFGQIPEKLTQEASFKDEIAALRTRKLKRP